jgi:S1-C subfamily serine protease
MLEYFTDTKGTNTGTRGTGSGVIISEDGYIVTNNHVIKEPETEITLNNKIIQSQTDWYRFQNGYRLTKN